MKKHLWLALICLLPIISKAQFVLKVTGTNLPDSVAYLRTTLFDDKNFIPKDTIIFSKGGKTIRNTKSIVGGIYFLYFPKTKQKIQFMSENNMNRTQLANYLGVTKGYISQLLNGNYNHKMSKFFELCLAFGVAPVIHYVPLDEFVKKETMILKSKAKKRSVV